MDRRQRQICIRDRVESMGMLERETVSAWEIKEVCVCERERESMCVCVCVCGRESMCVHV